VTRSTWQHLRLAFSFYLLPVFLFALSQTPSFQVRRAALVFIILHLLAYPASNGFNSYYDRDEGSIGGLEKPPVVTGDLLFVSLALDGAALLLGMLLGWRFVALLFVAGLASKAYSHPAIRLKGSPWLGWVTVAVFQGALTYGMVVAGISDPAQPLHLSSRVWFPALVSSLLLGGGYPLTQVYQHAEDARRGDRTLSLFLGVRGTFLFSGALLAVSVLGFYVYFKLIGRPADFHILLLSLLPIGVYWARWLRRIWRDESQATFRSAMTLSRLSATALNSFFGVLTFLGH
jgi:4-hydroxybenzoate polyprenyltransferase